ncbi:MAG: ATP-binding cassette domain-containing protein [Alphaproteobacteria bacterium]|nr:ATP-binding cassette domain-containing protein [Alphaproteobacteria bacterium]
MASDKPKYLELSGLRSMLPELGLATTVINILNLALPLALLQIYDRIIPHQSASTLGLLILGVVLALVLDGLVKIGRNYITGWLGSRFEHKVTCLAFRRLIDIPISDFERDGPSVYMERIRAASKIRDFYSGQALLALFDLPFAALYLGVIAMLGGWLVMVPVSLLAVFAILATFNGSKLHDFAKKFSTFEERRFSFIAQTLAGIHSVKAMAMEAMMLRRYEMLQDTNVHQTFDGSRYSITALNIGALFSQLSTILVVAAGAVFVVKGNLTPGALAACVTLTGRSLSPVQSALSTWMRFQGMLVAKKQIDKLFEIPAAPNATSPPLPPIDGGIRMQNVTFRFSKSAPPIFTDLSLTVDPGQCVAIVGDSGCGKSSLLSLMAGILVPTDGKILVDDYNMAEFSPSSLPRQIGYLPQQGVLFAGTILENITMFDPSLEEAALRVAADMGLNRIVATMRNGYNTTVGGNAGDSVPGGIKQRIAIARALVHDPRIILFDEANTALDTSGDDLLREYLVSLKGRRTLILVAHRPSLLKLADRVLVLEDGWLSDRSGKLLPLPSSMEPPMFGAPMVAPGSVPATTSTTVPGSGGNAAVTGVESHLDRPASGSDLIESMLGRFRQASEFTRCLPPLLSSLAWKGTPRQFAEALPHAVATLDLPGLRKVMASLGYKSRHMRSRLGELDPRRLPCLFVPDKGSAVVLVGYEEGRGYNAFDGGTGMLTFLPLGPVKGTAHLFWSAEQEKAAISTVGGSWIGGVVARFRPLMLMAFFLTIGANLMFLATPAFISTVYDRVVPSEDISLIPYLLFGLSIVLAIDWKLRSLRSRILSFMGARGEYIISSTIFQRILSLPAWATESLPVGGQVARIKDFESLRELFMGPLALLFYELPGTLVFVLVLGLIDGWLIVILLLSILMYILLGLGAQPGVARRMMAASQVSSQRQEFLTEALSQLRAVRNSGAGMRWYDRYLTLSGRASAAEFKAQQYSAAMATAAQTLGVLTGVSIITTCVVGTFTGTVAVGSVVGAMILTWRLVTPLQNGFLSLATLVRVSRSVRQIDNLMRMNAERQVASSRQVVPLYKGEISFARASFRYSADTDPVLLGVNFSITPGQVAAIAGPNGAGKSTLLKLVTGLYQPQAGSVRIDNTDIRQLDIRDLRSLISYAPQRCDLFYGTIAQNLYLAHPTATMDELRWAAEMAGLLDDIESLPEGFETRLADGQNDQIPNGFRQRMSLARAYLKPAPVMLFDEPGNGLDDKGDRAFNDAINQLRGHTTIMFVSHRPSHLRLADVVIYLQEGYVRQIGTYSQVLPLVLGVAK